MSILLAISYDNWKLNIDDEKILWLSVDRKGEKVNTLNRATIGELDQIIDCQII